MTTELRIVDRNWRESLSAFSVSEEEEEEEEEELEVERWRLDLSE